MNQVLDNPFLFSNTNKRYHTFSYAMKKRYGQKLAKIPLNANFTCPNRDGTKGVGGCAFCSSLGSGDSILVAQEDLAIQYDQNLKRARQKWPKALGMAYFQSFSNTYAPLSVMQELYTPFFEHPNVVALAIATRADCLDEATAAWLSSMQQATHKEVWLEFGLQTIHEKTAQAMHLCHTKDDLQKALILCEQYGLKSCVHIINGLPGENAKDMLETAQFVAQVHPQAIKIHMLHLLTNSRLGQKWKLEPFELLSLEEYVHIVVDQLEVLPPDMIIERVTGDGLAQDLLAPVWTIKKTVVANDIDKELVRRQSHQGLHYKK